MSKSEELLDLLTRVRESIIVVPLGIKDGVLWLEVEGAKYAYRAPSGTAMEAVAQQFMELMAHGTSQALAWLRSNAEEVYSPAKGQEQRAADYGGTAAGADDIAKAEHPTRP